MRFSVPDSVHRTLKQRAKAEGLSLSTLVLRELEKLARRPTEQEIRRRFAAIQRETND